MQFKLTEEQKKISKKNKAKAWKRLGITNHKGMILHHLDLNLRHEDVDEYIKWENVVAMTISEHTALHNHLRTGIPKSEYAKQRTSEAIKKTYEEGRIPNSLNKHWFNNREVEIYEFTCPEGFISGRLPGRGGKKPGEGSGRQWFTNGETTVWRYECPEGFVPGRGKLKK